MNIGEAVEQEERLYGEVETVGDLGDIVGGGCEAAETASIWVGFV